MRSRSVEHALFTSDTMRISIAMLVCSAHGFAQRSRTDAALRPTISLTRVPVDFQGVEVLA